LITGEHKGTWWLPRGTEERSQGARGGGQGAGAAEADAVMQLAVKQRMNTDSRRAIFCILMTADDYVRLFIHASPDAKE
jgi:nucleolar MIF4G domain-containing protein 1